MNDRWNERDRWESRGRDDEDDYQQRREGQRGERSSEYSSLPILGTNYGGGSSNEYSQHGQRSSGRYRDDSGDRDHERGFWDRTRDEVRSWMGDVDAEHRRQADHTGRGPKGYVRSDERIREDVNDRLMQDWGVDATDIEVAVASAEVTLSGTVDGRESKRRAEDIAASVSGVKDVQNNLRVRRIDPFASSREVGAGSQTSTMTSTGTPPQAGSGSTGTTTPKH